MGKVNFKIKVVCVCECCVNFFLFFSLKKNKKEEKIFLVCSSYLLDKKSIKKKQMLQYPDHWIGLGLAKKFYFSKSIQGTFKENE